MTRVERLGDTRRRRSAASTSWTAPTSCSARTSARPRRRPRRREVGATRGILRSLFALLREPGVTHVACAFDHVIESFRNDLFDGYKTSAGVPDDLMAQFPLAERAAHALGIVVWPMVEFEADDAIAAAAERWRDAPGVEQIVLCTPDKDMAQCVRGTQGRLPRSPSPSRAR